MAMGSAYVIRGLLLAIGIKQVEVCPTLELNRYMLRNFDISMQRSCENLSNLNSDIGILKDGFGSLI